MRKATVLICVLALGILFLFSGCKAPEVPEEIPEVPEEIPEVPEEIPEVPEEVQPAIEEGKWLSDLSCAEGKISAVITNIGDNEVELLKDTKILLRGLVVKNIVCDKMTLAPGESAICTDISGGYSLGATNQIIFRAPGAVSEIAEVTCE